MKIVELLRKVGILRVGGGTHKGTATPALLGAMLLALAPVVAFSQGDESGCPPNAHPEGDVCRCDHGYFSPKGSGRRAPASEACSAHGAAHLEGENCVCNDGYAIPQGKSRCVSLASLCARYDAVYNAGKGECECPPGTVENESLEKCVAATQDSRPTAAREAAPGRSAAPGDSPRRPPPRQAPPPRAAPERRSSLPVGEPAAPSAEGVGAARPVPEQSRPRAGESPAGAPVASTASRAAPPRRAATPSPSGNRPQPPPSSRRTVDAERRARESRPPGPPPGPSGSEPSNSVITLDVLAQFDDAPLSEEARQIARGVLLETAAGASRAEKARAERELGTMDSFMEAGLSFSDGGGEVQLRPVLDTMMEARRRSRVELEHRQKMAAYRERVREVKESEKLRPGVDREQYESLRRSVERTRQTLAWAEKEHAHQNVRLYEALHADENNLTKANFRGLGNEHRERFKVSVGKEKRYQGLTDDMVQAVASRDCFLSIEGAYKQMLAARERLRRDEAELESLLALPDTPAIEDTDRAIIHWYQ